jgi:hypothetical protein
VFSTLHDGPRVIGLWNLSSLVQDYQRVVMNLILFLVLGLGVLLLLTLSLCSVLLMAFMSFQVRDYIHVVDLADGHIAALRKLSEANIGMNLCHFLYGNPIFFSYALTCKLTIW